MLAVAHLDLKLSPASIATILQMVDWTLFGHMRARDVDRAYSWLIGCKHSRTLRLPDEDVRKDIKATLMNHEKTVNEYNKMFQSKMSPKFIDYLVYGYIRTNRSTEEIARVLNNEQVFLEASPLNPLNAVLVQRIFDYLSHFGPTGTVCERIWDWTLESVTAEELTAIETAFRKQLELPASEIITVRLADRIKLREPESSPC